MSYGGGGPISETATYGVTDEIDGSETGRAPMAKFLLSFNRFIRLLSWPTV